MELADLVGKDPIPYYGADTHHFRLGEFVFEAVEDPSDGYRSCLQEIKSKSYREARKNGVILNSHPIAVVEVVKIDSDGENFDGYELRDALINRVWGRIGTDHSDSYYPFFVCDFPAFNPEEKMELLDEKGEISLGDYRQAVRSFALGGSFEYPGSAEPEPEPKPVDNSHLLNPAWGAW